jgi:hypothetical protein
MQSRATTVEKYLAELPADRRTDIAAVRNVILQNLPKGYEEGMQYGMIGYHVPHSIYPAGYHCDPRQPLPFACLASQKNYMSLYLMSVYGDDAEATAFRQAWQKTGKKLDMGKSCIRFKRVEDLPLELIGRAIKGWPVKKHLAWYEKVMAMMAEQRTARAATKKVAAAKKGAAAGQATKPRPAKSSTAKSSAARPRPAKAAASRRKGK